MIDQQELEELIRLYGEPGRRCYTLKASQWMLERLKDLRGEVIPVLQRPGGKVLLHAKKFYPDGVYRLLSGGIYKGESVLEALQREVHEETGLEAEIERFLGLLEYNVRGTFGSATHLRDGADFVSYVFLLSETDGPPMPHDESEEISAFREISWQAFGEAARALRSLPHEWREWGEFRALAHEFLAEIQVHGASESATHLRRQAYRGRRASKS